MLHSYFKIALRHLRRNGRYALINVLGLGIALAFCILAFTQFRFAHSFDSWHRDAGRVFRVEVVKATNHLLHGACPATLAEAAPTGIPGVEAATRLDSRGVVVKSGDNVFNQQVHFADENFLDLFDFPLTAGQARLNDPGALLISEDMALKFFGVTSPVGQTLLLYADQPERKLLTVSGIFKNCPKNSSLRFDFLTCLGNQLEGDKPVRYDSWRWFVDAGFLRLRNPADAPAVEAALQAYCAPQNQANPDWPVERYRLEALPEMALNARNIRWNNLAGGIPPAAVWGNITVALMLLATACLNFANTTIAVGNRRLREMGVRKVMGGSRRQLMRQLLGEALLVCLAALGFGVLLVFPMADWYNATWEHLDLKIDYWNNPPLLLFLGAVTVLTTLLAGAYPAFYISAFNPSSIFRGTLRFGGASIFSRLMMGAQVAISLAAVVVGFSFARNAQAQRAADLGYARESLVGVETRDAAAMRSFQDAISRHPGVVATAATRHHVGFNYRRTDFMYAGKRQETLWFEVGPDYLALLEMKILAGTGFPEQAGDGPGAEVLVNETFAREIAGGQDIVGQTLQFSDTATYRVAGIVKDFMTDSPFDAMGPVVLHRAPAENLRYCVVKTRPEDLRAVYGAMETEWKRLFPYQPFTGFYQSEVLAEALEVSENIAVSMLIFAFVILLLTVSGLFAIVSLNALKQFRGLALRRVLGATAGNIAFHLNRNFFYVLLGATVAGCLLGRVFALAMLDSIYKIHAGVQLPVLCLAALCVLAVATATAGVKVWQVLSANLSQALKAE